MNDHVRVLAIDGGGVRGIIPALVLAELERRTGRPASSLFDLMAGTSTGGLVVLGLSMPEGRGEPATRTARIIELYEQAQHGIFVRGSHNPVHPLLHDRYPSVPIDRTLLDYFGDTMMSEAATDVLVTSYDMLGRDVVLISSRDARDDPELDMRMRTAARATSAAPTYFEAVPVTVGKPPHHRLLIDGGVCANNPAMCAYTEVRRGTPEADVLLVSLGTGTSSTALHSQEMLDWGLAHWSRVILHVVFDGVSEMIHLQLEHLLPRDSYFRLQAELRHATDRIDDASPANIAALRRDAEALICRCDAELDRLAGLLTA